MTAERPRSCPLKLVEVGGSRSRGRRRGYGAALRRGLRLPEPFSYWVFWAVVLARVPVYVSVTC